MAKSFSAGLEDFDDLTEHAMRVSFLGAAEDATELMTRRVDGLTMGAPFREGYVPVGKTSQLINSFVLRLNGTDAQSGAGDYSMTFGQAELDDVVDAAFTAPYARAIEYGFNPGDDTDTDYGGDTDVPGRFFVQGAAEQWPVLVAENVNLVRNK